MIESVPPKRGRSERLGASSSKCLVNLDVLRRVDDQKGLVFLSFLPALRVSLKPSNGRSEILSEMELR